MSEALAPVTQTGNDVVVKGISCPYCGGSSRVESSKSDGTAINRSRVCLADWDHRFITKEVVHSLSGCIENVDRDEAIEKAYIGGTSLTDLCALHGLHAKSVKRILRKKGLVE